MVINKNMGEKNIPDNKTRATGIKEGKLPSKIGHDTS
jgi:hypothetical protein